MYVIVRTDVNVGAAQTWFIAGTIPLILAGALHAALTVIDTVRPTYFAPKDAALKPALERTQIRFGGRSAPSMWRAWLGFNISHGLGVLTFGLICLLIAAHDFGLVERIGALRPLTIAFCAAFLVLSLRFWFWGPVLLTGFATTCFTVSAVLS
jgi:hypothetical protein